MSWQPSPQGLEEVLEMLRNSSSGDSEVQKLVAKVIRRISSSTCFLDREVESVAPLIGSALSNYASSLTGLPTSHTSSSSRRKKRTHIGR